MAVRGRPPKNGIRPEKKKKPEMHTKEDVMKYLEENSEEELPFVEEVWEKAVATAKENENKEQPYKIITLVDSDGNKVQKKQRNGTIIRDPVKLYFKLMHLTQNKKKGIAIKEGRVETDENKVAIAEAKFGDEEEHNEYMDEISSWIALFNKDEREYLKRRYVNYYDTYEINEGADKLSLKRLLSLEIGLYRIDRNRALGKPVNMVEEEKLTRQLNMMLESLKWTKKQRNAREDMAQNKFTIFMDSLAKEGEFKPNPKSYDQDEIDFLMETYINAIRDMLS